MHRARVGSGERRGRAGPRIPDGLKLSLEEHCQRKRRLLPVPPNTDLQNLKSEARNPKQIPNPNQTMPKTIGRSGVWDFGFSPLVLISNFGLRISDLTFMARWYWQAAPERNLGHMAGRRWDMAHGRWQISPLARRAQRGPRQNGRADDPALGRSEIGGDIRAPCSRPHVASAAAEASAAGPRRGIGPRPQPSP